MSNLASNTDKDPFASSGNAPQGFTKPMNFGAGMSQNTMVGGGAQQPNFTGSNFMTARK